MTAQQHEWAIIELQGFEAYNGGVKRRQCPYDRNSPASFYWQAGWFNGLTFELYRLRPWPLEATATVH